MPEYEDRLLKCMECGGEFVFTAGEQEFYASKGFQQEPKRCRTCRDVRKTHGRSGEKNSDPGEGRRDGGPIVETRTLPAEARATRTGGGQAREMFDATCAACGVATRVPFRPTPGRPVYCCDCYGNRRGH